MRSLALALLLLFGTADLAMSASLHISISDSSIMPLADLQENRLVGGILHDLIENLESQLNLSVSIEVIPRNRVAQALQRGEIDMHCYTNPKWIANSENYLWSPQLFLQRDVVVAHSSSEPLNSLDNLAGQSIGTVLGYNYPRLVYLFERGALQRDEARNQQLVLRKLLAGRYQYAVSNDLTLAWFNRDLPVGDRLTNAYTLAEDPVGCLLRNDPALPTQRVLHALSQMKESGEIEEILARYR